jgi:uncharacterized protein
MTNRLATCQSLYLRKHAQNPIDWWPWCDEALAVAKRDNKPIFLSIGYSSCHWCTVMEGEAFSDVAIATYLNAHFLPIKVDREERPDIDSIYMQALQMMVGQGGWPLNVFLSPDDLIPFYGGTYFPVDPRYGRPGFLDLLKILRELYDNDQTRVTSVKDQILEGLKQSALIPSQDNLSTDILNLGLAASARILAPSGYGTSFPMIPYALSALRGNRLAVSEEIDPLAVCRQRALDLVLGGIYDHVAGGFHRYTVDPTWTVPHFEKMLYDNGLILEFLAEIWPDTQEPAIERAIAGTFAWLKREMLSPLGYFYAAQDADSFATPDATEPEEGAFYIWQYPELEHHLTSDQFNALKAQFTLTPEGNFEGANVLQRLTPGSLDSTVETALAELFTLRYGESLQTITTFPPAIDAQVAKTHPWPGRIPAVTDTKMIVAWNSLMISGLARCAAVLQRLDYLQLATQVVQFILDNQWQNQRLQRLNYDNQATVLAQSEDYALFIKALLDVQQASLSFSQTQTQAQHWQQQALTLQTEFDQWFWDTDANSYCNTASDASDTLLIREHSYQDSATPAANGIAAANLMRLFLLTENTQYLHQAERILKAFSTVMDKAARACPSLLLALDWYHHPTLVHTHRETIPTLLQQYQPTAVFAIAPDLAPNIAGLVCQGLSCLEPATTMPQLLNQITSAQTG